MRSQLTIALAGLALLLTQTPSQAQTYQDYASGRAYVMTAPAGSTTAAAQRPTYEDYASGRAYAMMAQPAGALGGGAASLVPPWYSVPRTFYYYTGPSYTPAMLRPDASITTTVGRSNWGPSRAMQLSTTPIMPSRTYAWPSNYPTYTWPPNNTSSVMSFYDRGTTRPPWMPR